MVLLVDLDLVEEPHHFQQLTSPMEEVEEVVDPQEPMVDLVVEVIMIIRQEVVMLFLLAAQHLEMQPFMEIMEEMLPDRVVVEEEELAL